MHEASGFLYAGGLWIYMHEALRLMQKVLWAANWTKSVYNSVYSSSAKGAELRRIGQMYYGLAKGVSRELEVFGARKVIGKRGSRSTREVAVVGQPEDLLSTFGHLRLLKFFSM